MMSGGGKMEPELGLVQSPIAGLIGKPYQHTFHQVLRSTRLSYGDGFPQRYGWTVHFSQILLHAPDRVCVVELDVVAILKGEDMIVMAQARKWNALFGGTVQ